MTLSTAVQPFFDDYDENKQFYEILFRPSYAIQARELNQMQSILQKQIERQGSHFFTEGSMVIPGQISVDTNVAYVKLQPSFQGTDVETYLDELVDGNVQLTGQTSGVKARISHWEPATESDPTTIYIRYVSNDPTTGLITSFVADEVLVSDSTTTRRLTVMPSSVAPIGIGSTANIQRGVYFVNGRFVLCKTQTIVLDRYSNTPTYDVGLLIQESFLTPEEDSSLLDNSQGSTNYAAPGAHRYLIDLDLVKKTDDDTTMKNFILLAKLTDGALEKIVTKTDYTELEKTLARRTYDESGDYVVTPFNIQLREHRNNDRGSWVANTAYIKGDVVLWNGNYYVAENTGLSGTVAPTHTMGVISNGGVNFLFEQKPAFNNGVYTAAQAGDSTKIAVGLEPGKAYVLGHEIDKQSTSYVSMSKAMDYQPVSSGVVQPDITSLVKVTNMFGSLDSTKFLSVDLRDTYTVTPGTAPGASVGTAKARYIEYSGGTAGTATAVYTLGLFDIQLNSGKRFENDVRSIYFHNTTGVDFTVDVVKTITQLTGAITVTSASAAVTGLGTKFTTELTPGQTIRYFNGGTELISKILSIASDTSLTLVANATATVSNGVFYLLTSDIANSSTDSLIFPVSVSFVKTLRSNANPSLSTTNYYTKQRFSDTCVSGTISITTSQTYDTFVSSADPTAFLVVNLTTGAVISPTSIVLGGGSTTATITVGAGNNGNTIAVIAKVRRVLKERTKTMVRAFSEDITTQSVVQAQTVSLSNCDAQKLRKVAQYVTTSTGVPIPFGSAIPSTGVTEIDITNQWIIQGNQKDSYYDFSFIKMAPGAVFPNSPIRVFYDYYAHSNTGDFFCVDSYSTSPVLPPLHRLSSAETINLRDYIDFRPTRLTATTWSSSFVPALGEDFTTDYSYYLTRRDNIVIDGFGNFIVVTGSSGDVATDPHTLANTMMLYKLDFTPATEKVDTNNIKITRINNRRYTMKDIGDLDRRLQNVEYYTALNLLEEQTKNLQLFDNSGNLMFKNGFLVDSFSDMKVGDTNSNNYRCSIDTTARFMRPTFDIDSVNLIEFAANDIERAGMHYDATGGKFTLPYTETSVISQLVASHMETVTPYIQLNFIGEMYLNPNTDDWHETSHAPDILINDGIVPITQPAQIHDLEDRDPRKRFFQNNSQYYWWNHWQEVWVGRPDNSGPASVAYDPSFTATSGTASVTINENSRGARIATTQGQIQLNVVPIIRQEQVQFFATGLKPTTVVYPFFDSVPVGAYCVSAAEMSLTGVSGKFDEITDAGLNSEQAARSDASKKPIRAMNAGDVVHNGAGGDLSLATATAVVLHYLDDDGTGNPRLYLHNIIGTFSAGNVVHGTISGAAGTVASLTAETTTLKTNLYGEAVGVFTIPSSESIRFRAGERIFTLSDSSTNTSNWSTIAMSQYVARGVYLPIPAPPAPPPPPPPPPPPAPVPVPAPAPSAPAPVTSPPAPVAAPAFDWLAWLQNSWNEPTSGSGDGGGGGGDPLAQSFSIPNNGVGMFATSMDFYFGTKDKTLPVRLELREMLNGVPTTNVVPGSKVTKLPKDIVTSTDGTVATRFTFDFPVYLAPGKDYALVLSSDSVYYQVFVSQLGEDDILTGERIAKQPLMGSLFKSQNASVWTPDQMLDLKFSLNRAKFDTSAAANIRFVNQRIGADSLDANSIFTRTGTNKVRVFLSGHGHPVGSKVTFSGVSSAINGIPAAEFNTQKTVIAADFDSFVIQTTTNATSTGYAGTSAITATRNVRFDILNMCVTQLVMPGTSIRHFANTTNNDFTKTKFALEVQPNQNTTMLMQSLVMSQENEVQFNSGYKSLDVYSQLVSGSDFVSPVLDIQRMSMLCIANRVADSYQTSNIAALDDNALGSSTAIAFSGNTLTTVNATAKAMFLKARVGRVLTTSGSSNGSNNTSAVVTAVASDGSSITLQGVSFTTEAAAANITLSVAENYISEIAPEDGSSDAKYVIREMNLIDPAAGLKVFFDVNLPQAASVDVYYRVASVGTPKDSLQKSNWTLVNPVVAIKSFEEPTVFFGAEYTITPTTGMFDKAQIKLVLRSTNTVYVPVVKQLRMIAST